MSTSTLSLEDLSALRTQAEGGPVAPEVLYRLLAILETWLRQELDLYGGDRVLTDLMVGYVVKTAPINDYPHLEDSNKTLGYYYIGWGSILTRDRLLQLGLADALMEAENMTENSIDEASEDMTRVLDWLQKALLSEADPMALTDRILSPCLLVRVRSLTTASHGNTTDLPNIVSPLHYLHEITGRDFIPTAQTMSASLQYHHQLDKAIYWNAAPKCNSHVRNGRFTKYSPGGSSTCQQVPAL